MHLILSFASSDHSDDTSLTSVYGGSASKQICRSFPSEYVQDKNPGCFGSRKVILVTVTSASLVSGLVCIFLLPPMSDFHSECCDLLIMYGLHKFADFVASCHNPIEQVKPRIKLFY